MKQISLGAATTPSRPALLFGGEETAWLMGLRFGFWFGPFRTIAVGKKAVKSIVSRPFGTALASMNRHRQLAGWRGLAMEAEVRIHGDLATRRDGEGNRATAAGAIEGVPRSQRIEHPLLVSES